MTMTLDRQVSAASATPLGWVGIARLGMVQAALGAVVVLVTSTLNRVMVVEYALPALLPGMLVALHYAVQMIRPRFGFGSDRGRRRTPWIVGGMAVLAAGGILCAVATVLLGHHTRGALPLAIGSYALVGVGVGSAGTSLLVLMADRVGADRRAAASTIMWILMIAGFAITSVLVGHFLDPFSPERLIRVTAIAALVAMLVAWVAIWNLETPSQAALPGKGLERAIDPRDPAANFAAALGSVWSDAQTRRFTVFVFASMLAYSAEELLLEPFCGLVFGYSVGDSAQLSGTWHGAALIGMIVAGILCSGVRRRRSLRSFTIGGCLASAAALLGLACASLIGARWPLRPSVMALGVSNGVFAVSAIGSMMELAHGAGSKSAGVRMGLWGAAQAVAFALGGLCAGVVVDACRSWFGSPVIPFAIVFSLEASMFIVAARCASAVQPRTHVPTASNTTAVTV